MSERILTLHPEGKQGVNIDAAKYDQIKDSILKALRMEGEMPFGILLKSVNVDLEGKFEGSISWYMTTVKLDLEARGALICKRGKGPQVVSLSK